MMKALVLPWFIFINTYSCISLANDISTNYLDGSRLPMLIAIPLLAYTNFIAGKMIKQAKQKTT